MKLLTFSRRTAREILRDPLTLFFGIVFPLILLGLLTLIQSNIPVSLFELDRLTPGITVFGLSFMTLFSALLVAKDRSSALLWRLYTTPLTAVDYIAGYTLPLVPMAVAQAAVCYVAAWLMGLTPSVNMLWAVLSVAPVSLLFISLGLLLGSVLTDKQVGGVCGALVTNLTAWLSGIWFDLELVGGVLKQIAYALPFVHAVRLEQAILSGDMTDTLPHILWVCGYILAISATAVWVFTRQMKRA